MTPLAKHGRLIYFADLRPDHVEVVRDDAGDERTFVALAISEQPALQWELNEDQMIASVTALTSESAATETVPPDSLGEGTPVLIYSVLELDSDGNEIDDWAPVDLDDCKSFLDNYKGAAWDVYPPNPTAPRRS